MSGMGIAELQRGMDARYAKDRVLASRGAGSPVASASSSSNSASTSAPAYVVEISSEAKELSKQALEKSLTEQASRGIERTVVDIDSSSTSDVASLVTKLGSSLTFKHGMDRANSPFVLIEVTDSNGNHFHAKVTENTIINENKDGTLSLQKFSGLSGSEDDIIIDFSGDVDSGAGDDFIVSVANEGTLRRKGRVSIDGGAGNDIIYSTTDAGFVTLKGGAGNDYINVNAGNASLDVNSGAGHDFVKIGDVGVRGVVDSGAGDDTVSVTTDSGAALKIRTGDGDDSVNVDRTESSDTTIGYTDISTGAGKDQIYVSRVGSESNIPQDEVGGTIDTGTGADSVVVGEAYNLELKGNEDGADNVTIVEEYETPPELKKKGYVQPEFKGEIAEKGDHRAEFTKAVREAMLHNADENTTKLVAAGSTVKKQQEAAAKAIYKDAATDA
ncbi:MAG: hypothetical protein ACERJ1_09180 [Halodesulfovibrio sp.]|uniref:hypothetical protein n=1 Tax=Halodesulfovibrio sp. TaxID=1912772 RepID=UPI00359E4EA5